MGILDFFRRSSPESRSSTEIATLTAPIEQRMMFSSVFPSNANVFGSDAGEFVSERTALQHLAVYSCVRLLADSIASLPVDVFRKTKNGTRVPLDTPVSIMQPNPGQTGFEYMQQVVSSLALRGNSYEWVTSRDQLEYPLTRETVHPDDMRVTWNFDDGRADYQIRGVHVARSDVIHIRRLTLAGNIVGISPIEQARQGIGLSLAAERYGAKWFGDSADPSSVLETDESMDDAERMRVMQGWVSSHGGRRHPALLSGGLKYRPIAISPNESQFIETRAFQRGEIAMMFGIPPHMIGDTAKSTSWGTGIEQQTMGFVRFSLMPWLRCIEDTYSWLMLPRGQYMRFNLNALLRGDTTTRYAAYTQARNAGWMSVNEIRAKEDLEPIPDGDNFIQPLNMGPLGADPTQGAAPAAPAADTSNDA